MVDTDADDFRRKVEEKRAENPFRVLGLSPELIKLIPDEFLVEFAETYVNRVLARFFHPDAGRIEGVNIAKFNLALDKLRKNPAKAKDSLFSKYEKDLDAGKQLQAELARRQLLLSGAQDMAISSSMPREPISLILKNDDDQSSFSIWEIDENGLAYVELGQINDAGHVESDWFAAVGQLYDELEEIDNIGFGESTDEERHQIERLELQLGKIDPKYQDIVEKHEDLEGLSASEEKIVQKWVKLFTELNALRSVPNTRASRREELSTEIKVLEEGGQHAKWPHFDGDDWVVGEHDRWNTRLEWYYEPKQAYWMTRIESAADDVESNDSTLSVEPFHLLAQRVNLPTIKVIGSFPAVHLEGSVSSAALSGSLSGGLSSLSLYQLKVENSDKVVRGFSHEITDGNHLLCVIKVKDGWLLYYTLFNVAGVKEL